MSRARRWFQIHLSTAIALMLVASGLLWANMRKYNEELGEGYIRFDSSYGWPYAAVDDVHIDRLDSATRYEWQWKYTAFDAGIAFGTLVAVAVACEWALRRREGRTQ